MTVKGKAALQMVAVPFIEYVAHCCLGLVRCDANIIRLGFMSSSRPKLSIDKDDKDDGMKIF